MAFRYRQRTVEDGDIIVPDDFNVNQREFVSEFNGYLDRDNLPADAIGTALIKAQAFTEVRQKTKEATVELTGDSIQFHDLLTYSFTAELDGMLTVDWSGQWEFTPSASAAVTQDSTTVLFVTTVAMFVNGVQIGMIYRSSDARKRDSKVMYGALPVSAGNVTVTVRARYFALEHGKPKVKTAGDGNSVNFARQILAMVFRKR